MHRILLILSLFLLPLTLQAKNKSRVVGSSSYYYNTSTFSFTGNDSAYYKYSGIRSGSMAPAISYGWQYAGKYDSLINSFWDAIALRFYVYIGTWRTYDSHDNIHTEINAGYDTTTHIWTPGYRITYTYDASNNQTDMLQETWDTTGWGNYSHTISTYTATNDKASDTSYYADFSTHVLKPSSINAYTYDTHHNLIGKLVYAWSPTTSMWTPSVRYTYYVNSSYLQDSVLTENYFSGGWQNANMHKYAYSGGSLITDTTKYWITVPGTWRNTQLITSSYSGSDKTSDVYYSWLPSSSTWQISYKYTYAHDGNHNMTNKIRLSWSTSTSSYTNAAKDSNDYNSYNQPTLYSTYNWNIPSSAWILGSGSYRYHYYYEVYNDPTEVSNISQATQLSLSPNPATDILKIDLKKDIAATATFAIYDISGRQWQQWHINTTNEYHANIPISVLPAGSYILNIQSDGEQVTRQFAVIH